MDRVTSLSRRGALLLAAWALLFSAFVPVSPVAEAQSGRKPPEKARKAQPKEEPAQPAEQPGEAPQAPEGEVVPPPPLKPGDLQDAVTLGVNVVDVETVVYNKKSGAILQDLKQGNFEVYEDGVKQEVTNFIPTQGPMTVVMLIEFSRLIHNRYIDKAEVLRPLYVMTRNFVQPDDNVAIVAFDVRPEVVTDFTGDRTKLFQGLDFLIRNTPAFSESNLYDALAFVLRGGKVRDVEYAGLKEVESRSAVILVTIGRDTFSKINYDEIREIVGDAGAPIYTIGVGNLFYKISEVRMRAEDRLTWQQSFNTLRTFSRMSGGQYFPVTFAGEVPTVVQSITNLMRSQYSLGYTPSNTRQEGKTRKIEVKVDVDGDGKFGDKGYVVQHRETYIEPNSSKG